MRIILKCFSFDQLRLIIRKKFQILHESTFRSLSNNKHATGYINTLTKHVYIKIQINISR